MRVENFLCHRHQPGMGHPSSVVTRTDFAELVLPYSAAPFHWQRDILDGDLCSHAAHGGDAAAVTGARIILDGPGTDTLEGPGWELTLPLFGVIAVERAWRRRATFGLRFALTDNQLDHMDARLRVLAPRLA